MYKKLPLPNNSSVTAPIFASTVIKKRSIFWWLAAGNLRRRPWKGVGTPSLYHSSYSIILKFAILFKTEYRWIWIRLKKLLNCFLYFMRYFITVHGVEGFFPDWPQVFRGLIHKNQSYFIFLHHRRRHLGNIGVGRCFV